MHEVRLGEKGQVTLPKSIRDHYGLSKGDQLRFIDLGNGVVEIVLLVHSTDLPPPVVKPGERSSVDDMRTAIRSAAERRFRKK